MIGQLSNENERNKNFPRLLIMPFFPLTIKRHVGKDCVLFNTANIFELMNKQMMPLFLNIHIEQIFLKTVFLYYKQLVLKYK